MPYPREPDQFGVLLGDQIGQRAAGKIRGRDAVPDVTSRPRQTGRSVQPDDD